jgi:hypothetical protein
MSQLGSRGSGGGVGTFGRGLIHRSLVDGVFTVGGHRGGESARAGEKKKRGRGG